MKISRLLLLAGAVAFVLLLSAEGTQGAKEVEDDDDFAEFDDDFDEDELARSRGRRSKSPPPQQKQADPGQSQQKPKAKVVEEQDDDFLDDEPEKSQQEDPSKKSGGNKASTGFDDEEEAEVEDDDFEGIDDDDFDDEDGGKGRKEMPPPKLTITSVPMPARGWQAYWAELLMMTGIAVYMLNYIMGRYKNQKIAQSFFDINWSVLEENFTLLGDSTILEGDDQGTRNYQRMSDSIYQMWCSGRVCCEGMLLELKLLKRQDLVSILANIFRPAKDVLRISVEMGKEDMDNLVCVIGTKKTATKLAKEYNDVANHCPDRKPGEKFGLPTSFVVLSEMSEVVNLILDSKTVSVINKFSPLIDSIHVTDQFTGLKNAEPDSGKDLKPPEPRRFLFFTLNLPTTPSGNNAEQVFEDMKGLFQFIFYTIDRMKRLRLSREGKMKAEKNRSKIEEAYMKQTHVARAEAAAARKEEKRRLEKERILQEDDPEKQRRWEEKEAKREKKRKQPKMKQLKVKAL